LKPIVDNLAFFGILQFIMERLHYEHEPTHSNLNNISSEKISFISIPEKINKLNYNEIYENFSNFNDLFITERNSSNVYSQYLRGSISNPSFVLASVTPDVRRTPFPMYASTAQVAAHEVVADDYGYALLRDARVRQELLKRTVEMVVGMNARGVNAVVFCDRGARPIATLVAELWSSISDKPLPPLFFINTALKHQFATDASDVPADILSDLRGWLSLQYPDGENPLRDGDATVCVVDEVKASGRSAGFVASLVQRAFPDTAELVYCDWVDQGGHATTGVWRDRPEMIGAKTIPDSLRSEELATEQARMLKEDLRKLAEEYGKERITANAAVAVTPL
jgi:hypothetical protein